MLIYSQRASMARAEKGGFQVYPDRTIDSEDLAEVILKSDWLAAHDAEVAATAIETARDKMMPPLNWNLDPYTGNERPGTSAVDEVYHDVWQEMSHMAAEYRKTEQ